jgi:hypothetical protein
MSNPNIFISVGGTANDKQEQFVQAIEQRLRSENLEPRTVGRNTFSSEAPLKAVLNLMNESAGAIIIALERTYFPEGLEKRGGPSEKAIENKKFATPWTQIEAAMAYTKNKPLFLIVENGLTNEGLIEKGYDWYVLNVSLDKDALHTQEFNGVLASWKEKVHKSMEEMKVANTIKPTFDPTELTIGQILKNMKPITLWGFLSFVVGLIIAAFVLGQKLGN